MRSIDSKLQAFSQVPITHGTLVSLLKDYKTPNNKISRWISEGILIPLKKGMYLVAPELSAAICPLPLIANALYGPSYVSLDFALYHHGLIPENVIEITSVTFLRSKSYKNSFGRFSYAHIPAELFSVGVDSVQFSDSISYLMATPTKALCDKLLLLRNVRIYSLSSFQDFLLNNLRIDESELVDLDVSIIEACMASNRKPVHLGYLLTWVRELR